MLTSPPALRMPSASASATMRDRLDHPGISHKRLISYGLHRVRSELVVTRCDVPVESIDDDSDFGSHSNVRMRCGAGVDREART
jgi:hypothetical protein